MNSVENIYNSFKIMPDKDYSTFTAKIILRCIGVYNVVKKIRDFYWY